MPRSPIELLRMRASTGPSRANSRSRRILRSTSRTPDHFPYSGGSWPCTRHRCAARFTARMAAIMARAKIQAFRLPSAGASIASVMRGLRGGPAEVYDKEFAAIGVRDSSGLEGDPALPQYRPVALIARDHVANARFDLLWGERRTARGIGDEGAKHCISRRVQWPGETQRDGPGAVLSSLARACAMRHQGILQCRGVLELRVGPDIVARASNRIVVHAQVVLQPCELGAREELRRHRHRGVAGRRLRVDETAPGGGQAQGHDDCEAVPTWHLARP